jgi:glycosyltransferase involved in cell wall biosynthesis
MSMERNPVHLSVVVPCYNEAEALPALYAALVQELQHVSASAEIILVDDGSTDGTLACIRGLSAADPAVRYVALSRNFGKESAMLAGLHEATGDAVIIMDADLQHPPDLLGRMWSSFEAGADQVVARRTRDGDPWQRTMTARLYYRFVNAFIDVELVDGAGDFRLMSKRVVESVLDLPETNRFSKGLFEWVGYEKEYLDYRNAVRSAGESKWSLRRLIDYAVDGVISFNDRPLRAAIYAGMSLVGLAVLYLLWVIGANLFFGVSTPGYTTLLTAVTMFGGIQMITLGVIGEYVGRIYRETKRRPHFFVRETERAQRSNGQES